MLLLTQVAMNDYIQDDILDRLLFALRDRIPAKVKADELKKGPGKDKVLVDVFRGGMFLPVLHGFDQTDGSSRDFVGSLLADYQIAYYFRKSNQAHVVLLKV